MKTYWCEKQFPYDGSQLRSLFAYINYKVQGDSVISWIGPCNIPNEHMIDGEDLVAGEKICGDLMLHFIVEKFGIDLFAAVSLQRLLSSMAGDLIRETSTKIKTTQDLRREGDDLYFNSGKLSISIATNSPVSSLIHFAVNISNDGTPVQTSALQDLGIEPISFSKKLMERFAVEVETIAVATTKVRPAH